MPTSTAGALAHGTLDRLAEHYTDKLGLNWRRRAKLLASPCSDFADLADWDARLDVALEALRLLGPTAQQHMTRCLNLPINAGEAFALLCHALRSGLAGLAQATSAVARSLPGLHGALVAAMEWSEATPLWLQTAASLPLAARFDLLATRHRDAPQLLAAAFDALRAEGPASEALPAALRCLRYQGDAALAQAAVHHLDAGNSDRLRRVAAQAVLALAPPDLHAPAVTALLALVEDEGPQREAAARCLALHAPASLFPLLTALRQRPGGEATTRLYLQSLGWAGDMGAVPRLIEQLDHPSHARIAAASIRQLTGLDPVRDGWQGEALVSGVAPADDAQSSTIPPPDPDAGLPWPSRPAFVALWRHARARFIGAPTWLGGRPATAGHLHDVLRHGPLAWRPLAAARLQRLGGGALLPTRLPARAQAALMST
ncbi:hypothetical protein HLB44_07855 [Aquincola sp. S2]|uniref:TIGR02270 family protein n=1 Tax=Pseudaquabacterium terrae TaxID=2732868 RepID=A0ABX2EE64_9BURK|nr:hypothetical protein [Aquabacterium terrae]NRF66894.1 hypothetical protein [Aquabacterium terrae]